MTIFWSLTILDNARSKYGAGHCPPSRDHCCVAWRDKMSSPASMFYKLFAPLKRFAPVYANLAGYRQYGTCEGLAQG